MKEPAITPPARWTNLARTQIELLRVAEGFFGARVLFALNRLGVFEVLGRRTLSAPEVAASIGAHPSALMRLLRAGTALHILTSADGEGFRIADAWQLVLGDATAEGYLGHWLRFLEHLDDALGHLDDVVSSGGPDHALLEAKDPADLREFTLAMHDYAVLRGRELRDYLDTSGCRSLLDVGCGPGTYAFHLGLRNPSLTLYLLDLPEVLEITREIQGRFPLQNEIRYLPMDLGREEPSGSYDLVLVSNTLHMLGEFESRNLLQQLRRVVAPGGSLVIQAQFLDEDRLGGRWPVFMDLAQLCVTRQGRNHTVTETRQWLDGAGFGRIEFCAMSAYNTNAFLRAYAGDETDG